MNQKHIKSLSIIVLLLLMVVFPSQGSARLWQFGNGFHYAVDRVCRDGADMIAAFWGPPVNPGDELEMRLSAQQYHNDKLPDPQNTVHPPIILYGPLLDTQVVLMTYHDEPLSADLNDDGTIDRTFHLYGIGTLNWSSLQQVGDFVMFSGSDELILPVEDCYLDQLIVEQNASTMIDATQLFVSDDATDDKHVAYQLNVVPAHGTVRLDGMPLMAGDTFTQDDINNNRLTYQHDGSTTTSDSFTFHVRATTQISVDSSGKPGNNDSTNPSIADNARTIAFQSVASNLVDGDSNGASDIFVHNQFDDTTSRESIAFDGAQANGASSNPVIVGIHKGFGVYAVMFESQADNLINPEEVCDGVGANRHIFQRIQNMSTTQYSVSNLIGQCDNADGNASNPAIAEYSDTVVFDTIAANLIPEQDQNSTRDIYEVQSQTLSLISMATNTNVAANASSFMPAVSADANHVAFVSAATNLVSGDTNSRLDIFVRSRFSDEQVRVSVSTDGTQANSTSFAPSLSFDGRYVAFHSAADNLVEDDTNGVIDIFVRDRDTDEDGIFDEPGAVRTTRISVTSDDIQANGASFYPTISANGQYVAFESLASNLVSDDTNGVRDIFVHDRETGETTRVSVAADGTEANAKSSDAAISAEGSYVAFESNATNLVAGDTNESTDVFVHYRGFSSEFTLVIEPGSSVYLPLITR